MSSFRAVAAQVKGWVGFSLKASHHQARVLILLKAQDMVCQLRHQYGNASILEEILARNDAIRD